MALVAPPKSTLKSMRSQVHKSGIDSAFASKMTKAQLVSLVGERKSTVPRDLHRGLYRLMKRVHAFLRKHKITYWADSGTLLGAIRNGGIIPWDDDLDIGMLQSDVPRLKKLPWKRNKMVLEQHEDGHMGIYDAANDSYFCDIFVFEPTGGATPGIKLAFRSRAWASDLPKCHHVMAHVFPPMEMPFGTTGKIMVPRVPVPYLNRCYGPKWVTEWYEESHDGRTVSSKKRQLTSKDYRAAPE